MNTPNPNNQKADLLARAQDARHIAAMIKDDKYKTAYLDLAEHWERLARDAAKRELRDSSL